MAGFKAVIITIKRKLLSLGRKKEFGLKYRENDTVEESFHISIRE